LSVLWGIGSGEGGAIDGVDSKAAPEAGGCTGGLGFGGEGLVELIRPWEGEMATGPARQPPALAPPGAPSACRRHLPGGRGGGISGL
jgi:hypothetical protein